MSTLGNNLPVDLYTKIIPEILREDLNAGIDSVLTFWDDPLLVWDEGHFWNETGLLPVIKNIFFGIEKEEGYDLEEISHLTDLVDPDRCPASFLKNLSYSLGYPLEENNSEEQQREIIKSIIALNKIRGKEIAWETFYRTTGFTVKPVQLYKKNIHEENDQYSRQKNISEEIIDELLGTPGTTAYTGTLLNTPILPGSIRISSSGEVLRDIDDPLSDDYGKLIGQNSSGNINYATGVYEITFDSLTTTDVYASYKHITEAFPYRAARIDLDIYFLLNDDGPAVTFDSTLVQKILSRAEEVRPIHVLMRLVLLVLIAKEELIDFASDSPRCGPDKIKHEVTGEYRFYAADLDETIQDDTLTITQENGSTDKNIVLDDNYLHGNNYDILKIEFSDGQPTQYW